MTPIAFELTEAEAEVAAARAAWRAALADRFLARQIAPLAAFALAILFAAILGLTRLIPHRAAALALLAAAIAYSAYAMLNRRRLSGARAAARAWAQALRRAGPARLSLDEAGFSLQAAGQARALRFAEGLEIETASGLCYVWPRAGYPLVWPSRAHADAAEAAAFLAFARRGAGAAPAAPAALDDDDD